MKRQPLDLVGLVLALAIGGCTVSHAPVRNIQPTDAHAPAKPAVTYSERCKLQVNLIACIQLDGEATPTLQVLADQERTAGVNIDIEAGRPVYTALLVVMGPELIAASQFEDLLLNNGWKRASRIAHRDVYVGLPHGQRAGETVTLDYVKSTPQFTTIRARLVGKPVT